MGTIWAQLTNLSYQSVGGLTCKLLILLARLAGFEPAAYGLEGHFFITPYCC
jgi:hypothetical protein